MLARRSAFFGTRVVRLLKVNSIFTWSPSERGAYTRDTPYAPHSSEYIEQQLSLFSKKSMPAKIVRLVKGTVLTGPLNSNDIVLGSQAVYPGTALNLSISEILNIQETSPCLSKFTLKEDLQCIESHGDNQQPVYYVHHSKLKPGDLIPASDLTVAGPSI